MSHRAHPRIIENCIVIWLDPNIDESNADCQYSIAELRRVVSSVQTFIDNDQCLEYVTDIKNEKAFMIVSGALGQQVVPLIHDIPQLYAIYVFCTQKKTHEQWIKDYSKVKDIFTQIDPLRDILKQDVRQADINMTSISIVSPSTAIDLNQLDPSFMYSQLMKNILLKMKFNESAKTDFIEFCILQQFENQSAIDVINEFDGDYDRTSPIWWYTRDCFIYSMLNKALRTQDIETIIKMGFFMRDLHREIEKLHFNTDNRSPFTVYRGQGIQNAEFEKIKHSEGGLLSFNNFLSTSTDPQIAFQRAESAGDDPELAGVLFHMEINPLISTTPFASLDNVSYFFSSESEILFSMHTVFRIGQIEPIKNRLWKVELTLTKDHDEQLKRLTDHMHKEIEAEIEWSQLGTLMSKMGEYNKAEEIFNTIAESIPGNNFSNAIKLHNRIGLIKTRKGDHRIALVHHKKVLQLQQIALPSNHPNLAVGHSNVGEVYQLMGEYSTALLHFEMALKIHKICLPLNDPSRAISHHRIASVHRSIGNHAAALLHFQKAFEIQQLHLPSNHFDLATSHNDIGLCHRVMGDYLNARSHFEKALAIYQKSLPSNHPYIATSHNNIGLVYESMREHSNALSYFKKALEMRQQSLPPNHPDLAHSYHNVGSMYSSVGNNSIALSHYQKALDISQRSLSPSHPDLAMVHNSIGTLHQLMGESSTALLHYQKALVIFQQSLPSNHLDIGLANCNIGSVYEMIGNLPTALSHMEKALEIYQQSLLSNHPDLVTLHSNIAKVYQGLCRYDEAVQHLSKSVDIAINVFGPTDVRVQTLRYYLGKLRRNR